MADNSFNRITIDRAALRHNFSLIRTRVGDQVPVMAMVKADAYGHGMVMAAEAFAQAGCGAYGVAELAEAVRLRQAGTRGEIYVTIGFRPEDAGLFFQYDLIPVVYRYQAAEALSRQAAAAGRSIDIHIKVDSGMGRLGLLPADLPVFVDAVAALPGLNLAGIMSHFAEADDPASSSTATSFQTFADACRQLKNRFAGIRHIANSGAVLNFPDTCCEMVRVGIALYGYHPAGAAGLASLAEGDLRPAMSFTSSLLQVKSVPAGMGISYGRTHVTAQPTRVAVLPVGYEDGFSRRLSNQAEVLVGGRRVPVLGRVCMNMCMVDVTGLPGVEAGDEVVLLGRQGRETITADEIARKVGSISYEVLCLLGNNNQREYLE